MRAIAIGVVVLVAAATDAVACPVCAGRGAATGADATLVAIMLATPVILFGVGVLCIRLLWRRSKGSKK